MVFTSLGGDTDILTGGWFLKSHGPDWQVLGRWSPCLLPPFSGCFQKGRCARWVMETSLLNLPVFAHLNLGGIYLIVLCYGAAHKWNPLVFHFQHLLNSFLRHYPSVLLIWLLFPLICLFPPKLSHNPYRNQDHVYNLAARNLGFNKSPTQPSMSTNSLWD